jgi:hypothetical protein
LIGANLGTAVRRKEADSDLDRDRRVERYFGEDTDGEGQTYVDLAAERTRCCENVGVGFQIEAAGVEAGAEIDSDAETRSSIPILPRQSARHESDHR